MIKLRKYMNKRELILIVIVIIGIVSLLVNLILSLYRYNTAQSDLAFETDALSTSKDLIRVFSDMDTVLSVFISNVETMRANQVMDRDLVVRMQKELLNNHPGIWGISLIYEPWAYDGMDDEYPGRLPHSSNGMFMPYVWRNGNILEIQPFYEALGADIYYNSKNMGLCCMIYDIFDTSAGPVPTLGFYTPIFDETERLIGLGGVFYEIAYLEQYLQEHTLNNTVCLIITDKDGKIIAGSFDNPNIDGQERNSILSSIPEFTAANVNEIKYINTPGLFDSNYAVTANAISPDTEHTAYSNDSQLVLVHILERYSLLSYLASQDFAIVNISIACITVIAFLLLMANFLFKKKKDALTGIYSREIIENDLPVFVSEAVNTGKDACVIMADLDHFKQVNDTYGHMAGDLVLQSFTNIIKERIRRNDWAVRYGGEEILIYLPETSRDMGAEVAERIRKKLEDTVTRSDSQDIKVTASFGVAALTQDKVKTAEALIKAADQHLYCAKENGRNKVC